MDAVFSHTRGGLWGAANALMRARGVGIITGFFVPGATPPAAETDGPAAAALLARAFVDAGLRCRLATDTICAQACRVALHAAGAGAVPVDAVAPGASADSVIAAWRADGIDHALAIERSGPAADGIPRNMRGRDLSDFVAPLDRLFSAGPWRTIAIGDGGNELGMGSVPAALIAEHVPHGKTVGCVVPADHLIAAGVSHWGAYGLLAVLPALRAGWTGMRSLLDPALDQSIVAAMVADGPAVDGVTLARTLTIDGREMAAHHAVMAAIAAVLRGDASDSRHR